MVLKNFEDLLERLVEGTFARAFKADLQPMELGRQLIREIDNKRKLDVQGNAIAPNSFVLRISPEDYKQFSQIEHSLIKELVATVREYARREDLAFLGPVSVVMSEEKNLKVGVAKVLPAYDDSLPKGKESHCWVEGQGGVKYRFKNKVMTVGRLSECDIAIDDENISRRHAEFRPSGDSFELVDLDSTNGCKVNGRSETRCLLGDADEVTIGPIKLWFRQD